MYSHEHSRGMRPPPSPSRQLQIDPTLSFQSQQYYQQYPVSSSLIPNLSSPSGSESLGTPPEGFSVGKRSGSQFPNDDADGSHKRARKDDGSEASGEKEPKAKSTRGSRACTVCRRLKMKCVGAENGPPCKRCQTGNHECVFEESNRGKRSIKKHEVLARSMKKIEKTLDTVLRSLGNPSTVSGMISRSPSPSADLEPNLPQQAAATEQLLSSPILSAQDSQSHNNHPISSSPKLHSLPDNTLNPLGLLAEASLANRRSNSSNHGLVARPLDAPPSNQVGVASEVYFKPGPMTILPLRRLFIERQVQPEMLSFTSTDEVVALFAIFFDHLNPHGFLLDRDFHTPALVCSRSPFLLTTISAIASKFYNARPELHTKLNEIVKKLAFSVPEKGYKSVEIVQAYLLLTWWGSGPVERYEHDKTWLLLGMAIRMATDLNLHRKTAVHNSHTEEGRAREIEVHNRDRTWIVCFTLDRCISAQMGKPHTIKEDYIVRNVKPWCRSSVAIPSDSVIAAFCDLQRMVSRNVEVLFSGTSNPSGLQLDWDCLPIIQNFESQVSEWYDEWVTKAERFQGDNCFRLYAKFYLHYTALVSNSYGLQNALERSPIDIAYYFSRVHSSALTSISVMKDEMAPAGHLRYSPDPHFVQCSYAVLTLLKLLKPELRSFMQEQKNINVVREMADVLESVAASQLHTPALYSVFLRALIAAKKKPDGNCVDDNANSDSPSSSTPAMQNSYTSFQSTPTVGGMNNYPNNNSSLMNEFHFDGEMGPVVDISTFPPTMADPPTQDQSMSSPISFDNIFSDGFWDSVLVPGHANAFEGLSGGFVYGAAGSGIITPHFGDSPFQSGFDTPNVADDFAQNIGPVFRHEEEIMS